MPQSELYINCTKNPGTVHVSFTYSSNTVEVQFKYSLSTVHIWASYSSIRWLCSAAKVLILSMLLVVPPLTAYTHDPGGNGGNTIFLPVTISLGDITGCTPPFLLIELIIFTIETTSSLISRAGIHFISFWSIDRTHLTLSFTNLIPLSMKGTWEFVSQQYKVIPCSLNSVLHDSNARSAYITFTTKPRII